MPLTVLPFRAPLADYEQQADRLLEAWVAGNDRDLLKIVASRHPKFLRDDIPWLARRLSEAEARAVPIDRDDARLALARWYDFRDWNALVAYVTSVGADAAPVTRFETAVEAVVNGDAAALNALLDADPALVRARSTRITHFDPPEHRSTLLHYIAANGVEGYRQKTPPNAVAIATLLLKAGAEPDALSDAYGGKCTTMALLVSSCHPARAGVQGALVDTLVDFGAAVEAAGTGHWTSPLLTALVFGYRETAETLVRRGARVDTVSAAAGLGRTDTVRRLLPGSDAADRHRALALAAQLGHAAVVQLLLDAGEDPNRFNPPATHAHSTPMHQAALAGHLDVVQTLVGHGARVDIRDTVWDATPLGWAEHGNQRVVAEYLRERAS